MTSFCLKLIAIVAMLVDHTAYVLVPADTTLYLVMRGIGRLAFPIFSFLIVEGFYHTRNVYKYMGRLAIFAIISEIPFNLAFYGTIFASVHQNIFFTLFLGLLVVQLISQVREINMKYVALQSILPAVILVVGCLIASCFHTDYGAAGVLQIAVFYYYRKDMRKIFLGLLIVNGFIFGGLQTIAILSLVFIFFYNGEKGRSMKYFFYLFYPVHLVLLYMIHTSLY